MPISTDLIVILAFLLFFYLGWRKGFMKSIIGPIALIIASIFSIQYYFKTQDMLMALVIGVFGPFILHIIFAILIKIWHISVSDKKELSTPSRFIGGCFSLFWRGSIFVLMLILIVMIPLSWGPMEKIQLNITQSRTYQFFMQFFGEHGGGSAFNLESITDILEDPEKLEQLQETDEFNALVEDKTLKEIFEDEDYIKIAQEKDFAKLLSHPNTQKILQDKNLVQKIMSLQKEIITDGFDQIEIAP